MLRRALAVLPLFLACACGSAQDEVPPPKPPVTPAPTVKPVARPPRKLDGAPVVLALRKATPMKGVDWVWIMPEGRLATVAPPDAKGLRAILGPNFFSGPNGAYVGLEMSGDFDLAADGAVHKLGRFDQAAFDDDGDRVLVWTSMRWALHARDGRLVRDGAMPVTRAALLPGGGLVEHGQNYLTNVVSPDGALKAQVKMMCNEVFPAAKRMACIDRTDPKGPIAAVVALDSGQEMARFSAAPGRAGRLSSAVRADGGAIAIASDKIEVVELTGKPKTSSKVVYRRSNDYLWRVPRMAFTADGKRLCVEEVDATRVIDPAASEFKNGAPSPAKHGPIKSRTLCLFAPRGSEPAGPGSSGQTIEWDAMIVDVAAHDGFDPPPRVLTPRGRIESAAVSWDRKTGVLVEQRTVDTDDKRELFEQAVVFDPATGAERRIVPLGSMKGPRYMSADVPMVELSDDGKTMHVCAPRLFQDGCHAYTTATGEQVPFGVWPRPGPPQTEFNVWSGDWPDAHIADVLASLSVPVETKAKIAAWSDEGTYVSIEMDPGTGATVHLNMPDTAEHVVRDVQAVAGGAMLALASAGVVELWKMQPLELSAVLVGLQDGGAALFADGSVEAMGKGEAALGCQQGEQLAPIDRCGDVWADKGTLAAIMKSARNGM